MFEEYAPDEDTAIEVQHLYFQKLSQLTAEQRLIHTIELISFARELVRAGIMTRHPNCSPSELRKRFAAIMLGREFCRKHLDWDPEIMGY